MRVFIVFVFSIIAANGYSQMSLEKLKSEVVKEGFLLFESEKASWHGTDLFMEKFSDKSRIGGYVSYTKENTPVCIFYSKDDNPKVIGTIRFDKEFKLKNAIVDLKERNMNAVEKIYVDLNNKARERIMNDTIFKMYQNTNYNLVPIVNGKERKVYVLTASSKPGTVIIGNDYLISFDNKNAIKKTERLHRSMLTFNYGDGTIAPMHNHLDGFCEVITATDICTTMLYQHLTGWENHYVVSKKYVSIWDCIKNDLVVMKYEDWLKTIENKEE